jgi:hypothetical protein
MKYNIHDLLTIQINRSHKFDLMKDNDVELSFFGVSEIEVPDITLNVGKFTPNNANCYVVDHKYYVKYNYFYCKDQLNGLTLEVEIIGLEKGNTIVNFNYETHSIKKYISHNSYETILLRPLIFYKLALNGHYMIHAAGVEKDNRGYIFPSRGGAFKTSIVMNFLKHGYNYLGDDWVILSENNIYSFPAHFALFNYSLNTLGNEKLSLKDKINFVLSLERIKVGLVNVTERSVLDSILFLSKTKSQKTEIRPIDLDNAVEKIMISIKMEMNSEVNTLLGFNLSPFYTYLAAYSYIFPENNLLKIFDNMQYNLLKYLKNFNILEIQYPETYNEDLFENISKIITG